MVYICSGERILVPDRNARKLIRKCYLLLKKTKGRMKFAVVAV